MDELVKQIRNADKLIHQQIFETPCSDGHFDSATSFADIETASPPVTLLNATIASSRQGSTKKHTAYTSLYTSEKIKKVCDMILTQCQFLLPQKILNLNTGDISAEEKLLCMHEILQYIGVENQEDLDQLVSMFYSGQDEDDENICTEYEDVLQILKEFMEQKASILRMSMSIEKKKNAKREIDSKHFNSEILNEWGREIKKYWEHKQNALPQSCLRHWQVIDVYLQKHYLNLVERLTLYKDIIALEEENTVLANRIKMKRLKAGCCRSSSLPDENYTQFQEI